MIKTHDDKEQQYETRLEDEVAKFMIYLLYYTFIKKLIFIYKFIIFIVTI